MTTCLSLEIEKTGWMENSKVKRLHPTLPKMVRTSQIWHSCSLINNRWTIFLKSEYINWFFEKFVVHHYLPSGASDAPRPGQTVIAAPAFDRPTFLGGKLGGWDGNLMDGCCCFEIYLFITKCSNICHGDTKTHDAFGWPMIFHPYLLNHWCWFQRRILYLMIASILDVLISPPVTFG